MLLIFFILADLLEKELINFEIFLRQEIERNSDEKKRLKFLKFWIWISKSLLLKEDDLFLTFINKVK